MMFEELIEKIEALYGKAYGYGEDSNAVINDVLDMVRACDPPELDAPTGPGWWWYIFKNQHPCCWYIHKMEDNGALYIELRNDRVMIVDNFAGKWIRAIAPKGM